MKVFSYFIIMTLFFSCSKNVTIIQSPEQVSNRNEVNQGGTDSTGGGNGINGKPLDDYILNIRKIPAYKNLIIPLIEKLRLNYPELAADFYHISIERDWYFVPISLDKISKNNLGIYAPTDQIALQDLNKIMIDSQLFDTMTEQDQYLLIVHEIIMGIYLIKYQKTQDFCKAESAKIIVSENNYELYEKSKKKCRELYPFIPGTKNEKFSLSSNDYDFIRKIVRKVTNTDVDFYELKSIIEDNYFRNYKN